MIDKEAPKISWYSKLSTDAKFAETEELYAGTHRPNKEIRVNIQLWNNRWGKTDVQDLTNFLIIMYFHDAEDAALLENCIIEYKNKEVTKQIENNTATLLFDSEIAISGKANDGNSSTEATQQNYISFDFVFSATDKRLKEDDLKSLFFEIVEI